METRCRLCCSPSEIFLIDEQKREYFKCPNCSGIQLSETFFLSQEDEKTRYLHHNNDIGECGYREFLSQLLNPVLENVGANSLGLDYGSGPSPSLVVLFQEAGITVKEYDPFFKPDDRVLSGKYDFICCSETAEHFKQPAEEFKRLKSLLKPNGTLALMTLSYEESICDFANWFYRKDPTHVFFYQLETLEYLARTFEWQLDAHSNRVFLLRGK